MLKARKILATVLSTLTIFLWSYMVGRTAPAIVPEFIASGCFVVVGILIALTFGYLLWPQEKQPAKAQPLYGRRQPCSDTEEWKRFLENYAAELADLRRMK